MRRGRKRVPPAVQQVVQQVKDWAAEHQRVTGLLIDEVERRKEHADDDPSGRGRPADH